MHRTGFDIEVTEGNARKVRKLRIRPFCGEACGSGGGVATVMNFWRKSRLAHLEDRMESVADIVQADRLAALAGGLFCRRWRSTRYGSGLRSAAAG